MDEVLVPGWRDIIEAHWTEGCNRLRYRYIYSWISPNVPNLIFYAEHISGRHTHRWKHPVHEILVSTVTPEIGCYCYDVLIEHHPDNTKSRSQYLPLLELAARENPYDDRCAHYLGRELFWYAKYEQAIVECQRHISLPRAQWVIERAASMRYIAKSYEQLGDKEKAEFWFDKAIAENPQSREPLIDAATFALSRNLFKPVIDYCNKALALPANSGSYLSDRYALNEGPYDLLSVAYFYLGEHIKAISLAETAVSLNPGDIRLINNLNKMKNETLKLTDRTGITLTHDFGDIQWNSTK